MRLSMRKTGLSSSAYADWFDCAIYDGGREIGRIYEDRYAPAALRWYWSITMFGSRDAGIRTDGCAPTLEEAKRQFHENLRKYTD